MSEPLVCGISHQDLGQCVFIYLFFTVIFLMKVYNQHFKTIFFCNKILVPWGLIWVEDGMAGPIKVLLQDSV